jgi:hypothetical protein
MTREAFTGYTTLTLRDAYELLSHLYGRFYQNLDVFTQTKLLHKMMMDDEDLEEAGVERDAIRGEMMATWEWEQRKKWKPLA